MFVGVGAPACGPFQQAGGRALHHLLDESTRSARATPFSGDGGGDEKSRR